MKWLDMIDFRLIENRREAFIRWMHWSIHFDDCDPSIFMTNYLFDRFEHNTEQKLWIAWLYGTTYCFATTWVLWNEFPDFELVDQSYLKRWNDTNYKRLRYQVDTRYNKGFLPDQYKSYKDWIISNGSNQQEAFSSILTNDSEKNFDVLYKQFCDKLYKFGRYSTWFYLQTLKNCCGLNVKPSNLLLSDSGSRSHRNGLCYAIGRDDWVDAKLKSKDIDFMDKEAESLLEEVNSRVSSTRPGYEDKVDYFAMETCLCSFKKIFRDHHGRYLGYYLDRQGEEISNVSRDGWNGICWDPLWDSRTEHPILKDHPELLQAKVRDEFTHQFVQDGSIIRMDYLYPEKV